MGPRLSHSTACASGLIAVLTAVRSIQDDQCDMALAGSAEAITPLFAAGFHQMKVLADHDDPRQACRPFDLDRQGFVMGEGGAMFVLERMQPRPGPRRQDLCRSGRRPTAGHGPSRDGPRRGERRLSHLITETLRVAQARAARHRLHQRPRHRHAAKRRGRGPGHSPRDGTCRRSLCVSATKSILGHLINAAGQRRTGDHGPGNARRLRAAHAEPDAARSRVRSGLHSAGGPQDASLTAALKLSVAFGGTLAAVALRRPDIAGALRRPLPSGRLDRRRLRVRRVHEPVARGTMRP